MPSTKTLHTPTYICVIIVFHLALQNDHLRVRLLSSTGSLETCLWHNLRNIYLFTVVKGDC